MNSIHKIHASRNEICRSLVHCFRIFQRLNRFVTQDMSSDLTILESLLLYELDGDATRSVTELALVMQLDKATISRTLRMMEKKKLIRIRKDPKDARRIEIEIMAHGYKVLDQNDAESNQLLKWFTCFLSEIEQHRLKEYFKRIADAFGTPISPLRKNDFEIRLQMRRLAKSLGYLKDDFFNTGFTPPQWQVLAALADNGDHATPAFLTTLLSTPSSYMSRLLTGLVSSGLVKRPRAARDSRIRQLFLTDKGWASFYAIENAAASFFEERLLCFSDEELHDCLTLFRVFIRETADGIRLIDRRFGIRLARTEDEKRSAIGFLLRSLVRSHREAEAPYEICSPADLISILTEEGESKGVLVVESNGKSLQAKLWFVDVVMPLTCKEMWKEQLSILVYNYVRGVPEGLKVDTSQYIGNV